MPHDEAFDMPFVRFGPTTSYPAPVVPPSVDPDGGTLVQIPCVAQEWIPFMLGALDQLRLPSTWAATDDDAMLTVLQRAEQLRGIIASWGACEVLSFDCLDGVPRYSTDGGATWTALPDCFTGPAGPTGPTGPVGPEGPEGPPVPAVPPNPQGSATADEACNIAAYLAALVIKASFQQQVDAINAAATLLDAALGLVALIPGLDLVAGIGIAAAYALNTAIASAGTSAYSTALADAGLWSDVQCSIYNAISAVGYVDATNYDAVETALAVIPYSDAGIVTTLANYWTNLTLTGVQAAQYAGSLYVGDCSACDEWCYGWGTLGTTALNVDWVAATCGATEATYASPAWASVFTGLPLNNHLLAVQLDMPSGPFITGVEVEYDQVGGGDVSDRYVEWNASSACANDGTTNALAFSPGSHLTNIVASGPISFIRISVRTRLDSVSTDTNHITGIRIRGQGDNPFGGSNCI